MANQVICLLVTSFYNVSRQHADYVYDVLYFSWTHLYNRYHQIRRRMRRSRHPDHLRNRFRYFCTKLCLLRILKQNNKNICLLFEITKLFVYSFIHQHQLIIYLQYLFFFANSTWLLKNFNLFQMSNLNFIWYTPGNFASLLYVIIYMIIIPSDIKSEGCVCGCLPSMASSYFIVFEGSTFTADNFGETKVVQFTIGNKHFKSSFRHFFIHIKPQGKIQSTALPLANQLC